MSKTTVSIIKIYLKENKKRIDKILNIKANSPYMKYKEIALLRELLINLKPEKCLEYGCGYSSLYFPKFLPKSATWMSVEHNLKWYSEIKRKNRNSNVELFHINANNHNYIDEGKYKDFMSYVNFPETKAPFDFILIDGMARNACIDKAKSMLSEKGVIVVHDSNRNAYHSKIKEFSNWMILEDFRKSAGGVGFASNKINIGKLFDIEYHRKIWKTDTKISNLFKFKFILLKRGKPFRFQRSIKN